MTYAAKNYLEEINFQRIEVIPKKLLIFFFIGITSTPITFWQVVSKLIINQKILEIEPLPNIIDIERHLIVTPLPPSTAPVPNREMD